MHDLFNKYDNYIIYITEKCLIWKLQIGRLKGKRRLEKLCNEI